MLVAKADERTVQLRGAAIWHLPSRFVGS